jgi:cation transport regulator ChaC
LGEDRGVWVFGYGSLMIADWQTEFQFERRQEAELPGYRRLFNKASVKNWGTHIHPGPTLNVEEASGSSCKGTAFEFRDEASEKVYAHLREREGGSELVCLSVKLQDGSTVKAVVPICRAEDSLLRNKSPKELAAMARQAVGERGPCLDYVANVARTLANSGIDDPAVQEFWTAIQTEPADTAEEGQGSAATTDAGPDAIQTKPADTGEERQGSAATNDAGQDAIQTKPADTGEKGQGSAATTDAGPDATQTKPADIAKEGQRGAVMTNSAPAAQQTAGVLSVEVKAPPIVAGTTTTVTLVIRNPFPHQVVIDSIEAPSSPPLLPRRTRHAGEVDGPEPSLFRSLVSRLTAFELKEVSLGPLVAHFPSSRGRQINVSLAPRSKFTVKTPFGLQDRVNISSDEGAEILFDVPEERRLSEQTATSIAAYQEDVATFELPTEHWLLVTPKILDLYAVIRYRLGEAQRSQVVPFSVAIRPPLTAIVCGSIAGAVLGYVAHQLAVTTSFAPLPTAIAVVGVIVMAVILAIVLSRQENTKGFVTLEDFYGAFVVGVLLGYTGTAYFEGVLKVMNTAAKQGGAP